MATQDVKIRITALDKTKGALGGIAKGLGAIARPLLSLKTLLAGLLGATGMTLLVRQSLLATDALAKTADKIGTTTEALSALQFAGKLTGVEVNTMNMALQRFTRRASEAARGTGEAKGALRELRLDARELVKLPLDQQMLQLADAFEDAKRRGLNPLRLAFKLFDSEGAQLVTTLAEGREGLSAMFGEARALGIVMSAEAAAGVEKANDEFLKLNAIFKGILDQTTAALAPALTYIVESISKSLLKFGDAQKGFAEVGRQIALSLVNGFRIAGETIIDGINGIISKVNAVKNVPIKIQIAGATGDIRALSDRVQSAQKAIELFQLKAKGELPTEQTGAYLAAWGRWGNIERATKALKDAQPQLEESLQNLARMRASLNAIDPLTLEGLTGFTSDEINEFFDGLTASVKGFSLELGKAPTSGDDNIVNKYLDSLQSLSDRLPQDTDLVTTFANNTMNAFTNGFASAITGAEKFSDAIRNMAKSVIDDLIRMAVQYFITQQIFGAIVGAFAQKPLVGPTGIEFGPAADHVGKRAMGGPVTGGRPYLVGERGPELMIPSGNGTVVPNNALGGGGVTVVQNINVTTGVQQTVRAEIANLLPQISNAAKAAVADSRMRGGGFGKAMVGV